MPAYTIISCSFDKRDRAGLVGAFYDAFFGNGVTFNGVFAWYCDADLTLEQIVEWNQSKLDSDFVLGYDEHVKHNYRQIMLAVDPFSECRLILSNCESDISFQCIVPEREINKGNAGSLEHACQRAWSQLPIQSVESYGELGEPVGAKAITSGKPPSADLFAMVDYDCTQHEYVRHFTLKRMNRGYLLKPNYV